MRISPGLMGCPDRLSRYPVSIVGNETGDSVQKGKKRDTVPVVLGHSLVVSHDLYSFSKCL